MKLCDKSGAHTRQGSSKLHQGLAWKEVVTAPTFTRACLFSMENYSI